jgi:DNA mismatch repair ATPase MutS
VLRKENPPKSNWVIRLFEPSPPSYAFKLHPRDEGGFRDLAELRDRGINLVANALVQSTEHILSFFQMLHTELAFYIGCLNLHGELTALSEPVCFPEPFVPDQLKHTATGLYDVCLALTMQRGIVANDLPADGKELVIITGANQGGKSTFLRAIGLAQLMMQCGMFVSATSFDANICPRILTHYKREEDTEMKSGKFDEELARMSNIVDHIVPGSLMLFNESFAATNEREGSEIARQIVTALLERHIKVVFVTHQYEFAHSFQEQHAPGVLFLRAERQADGSRPFKLAEGEPLPTSFGQDLYREIFSLGTTSPAPE